MVKFGCFRCDITLVIKIKGINVKKEAMLALKS